MNSPKVQQAMKEVFEELEALSPEEFRKFIDEQNEQFPELDTVSMLRES